MVLFIYKPVDVFFLNEVYLTTLFLKSKILSVIIKGIILTLSSTFFWSKCFVDFDRTHNVNYTQDTTLSTCTCLFVVEST